MKKDDKKIVDFIFELGQLKRVQRSGWWLIGIKDAESVAEHSFRAAAIGLVLAKMEGVDVDKVLKIALFNDMHEARLNDLHKLGQRYIPFKEYEKKAFDEQVSSLPNQIRDEFVGIIDQLQNEETDEGVVARDADLLECAFQAKEYIAQGYAEAQSWIDNVNRVIKTESAKRLLKELERSEPTRWFKDLKKIER